MDAALIHSMTTKHNREDIMKRYEVADCFGDASVVVTASSRYDATFAGAEFLNTSIVSVKLI